MAEIGNVSVVATDQNITIMAAAVLSITEAMADNRITEIVLVNKTKMAMDVNSTITMADLESVSSVIAAMDQNELLIEGHFTGIVISEAVVSIAGEERIRICLAVGFATALNAMEISDEEMAEIGAAIEILLTIKMVCAIARNNTIKIERAETKNAI